MADSKTNLEPQNLETSFPKNKINILLLEKISPQAVNLLVSEGYNVETANILNKDELCKKLAYSHVIGVRSKTKLTSEILSKYGKKLLCIGAFCIGTDQTDLDCATMLGIPVFNSPFANTRSVAELVISNIIALSRKVGDQNKFMHQGMWKKTAAGCYEVRGKTVGIVGYGHVGSQLSVLSEALGLNVIFYDIIPKLPLGNAKACNSLIELLNKSDFVSLHVPYTSLTHEMISEKEIKEMKKGSYLLNAARGKCVVIKDVANALKSGYLAGAYFDVYPKEPITKDLCLINCPNTILTPHIGGSTQEAQENIGIEVANKIIKFINEGQTLTSVNFPSVSIDANINTHRILNIHKNVPGVLKKINEILCEYNVSSQYLKTNATIGYLLIEMDANKKLTTTVKNKMDSMLESIRTRVLFSPGAI